MRVFSEKVRGWLGVALATGVIAGPILISTAESRTPEFATCDTGATRGDPELASSICPAGRRALGRQADGPHGGEGAR